MPTKQNRPPLAHSFLMRKFVGCLSQLVTSRRNKGSYGWHAPTTNAAILSRPAKARFTGVAVRDVHRDALIARRHGTQIVDDLGLVPTVPFNQHGPACRDLLVPVPHAAVTVLAFVGASQSFRRILMLSKDAEERGLQQVLSSSLAFSKLEPNANRNAKEQSAEGRQEEGNLH